jgi:hypothetical protein
MIFPRGQGLRGIFNLWPLLCHKMRDDPNFSVLFAFFIFVLFAYFLIFTNAQPY